MPEARAWSGAAGTQDRIGLGIAGVLIGMLAMSIMDALAKWLGEGYPIAELVFFRNLFALPPALFIIWQQSDGWTSLALRWKAGHVLRAILALGATFTFFLGLRYLPLAEAISIAFAAPLLVTALSVPILGERVGPRRWTAVIAGFIGVLVMTRPGAEAFRPEALYIVAAAFGAQRHHTGNHAQQHLHHGPAQQPGAAVRLAHARCRGFPALGAARPGRRHRHVFHDPGLPLRPGGGDDYTALLWGTLIGWLVWHELPGANVWLGAAIVIASSLYIVHRETRAGR
jgi:drug/metabolite transporter (DMT)-like permease